MYFVYLFVIGILFLGWMIKFWGVEEIGNWLESLGLVEYKELFVKYDIRGFELLVLDRFDLKVSLFVFVFFFCCF